eukprot:TRINITY_DN343_c0_g1_i3.p1 TRINITY_DN343_c0_g1~~TRINITY_DN343_c0_g1_i3.p1  ORF type:complete len:1028 (-),score=262.83 TRINITY_DN343_c0_g1_i3:62-3145(-)
MSDDEYSSEGEKEDVVEEVFDDEDDDEEEDDDDEEEDEMDARARKRPTKRPKIHVPAPIEDDDDEDDDDEEEKPRPRNRFLLEEAAEESDDEIEESDEDELGEKDEAAQSVDVSAYRRKDSADDRRREGRSVIDDIEKRYVRGAGEAYVENDQEERTPIRQQSCMPSVRDPKLWRVKCRQGKEKEIVILLLQKYFFKAQSPEKLLIKSVVYNDNIKGFVYVEAEKEAHVKTAIEDIKNMFTYNLRLVPIKEMTDVLKPSKKRISLQPNSWVRVKRGLYSGDLAQVISYDEAKLRATVKLVPRLESNRDKPDVEPEEKQTPERDPITGKRKKSAVELNRPPARFFNPSEHNLDAEGPYSSRDGILFEGNKYKDGYLHKVMNIKSLKITDVAPQVSEVQKFMGKGKSHSEEEAMQSISKTVKKSVTFSKGDTVRVVEGDLIGLMGIVESVETSNNESFVIFNPQHEELKDWLRIEASKLEKYFRVGDHCKVISGRYEGETGLIVSINDNIVIMISDLTRTEIKVLASDIQECTEVSTGKLQLGNYELHDLVQLSSSSVGVIVKVESDSFKVLDNYGNVQTVRLQEMGAKRHQRDASSFDKSKNQIGIGDIVLVTEGKYKGRQGTIRYIFRSYLFLHSRDMLDNSGIFVVRAASCTVLGGGKSQFSSRSHEPMPSPRGGGRGYGNTRGDMRPPSGGRGRGDSILHKTVTITGGPWKGLVGIVKDANEQVLRIELHTNCKTVSVKRNLVKDPTQARGDHHSIVHSYPSYDGSRTPLRDGSQTPLRMNTPLRRSDGGMTPLHDPWSIRPNTPMRPDTPGRDRDDDYGVPTPGYSYYSPAPNEGYTPNANPSTPSAFSSESAATPFTPGIGPYSDHHTPQDSPFGNVNTPGTPSTPGIPATPTDGSSYEQNYDEYDGEGNWQSTDIEVRIENDNFGNGAYKDKVGVIKEVYPDNTCRVKLYDRNDIITLPGEYLSPVVPGKKDKIKVIRGDCKGNVGVLIGIDGRDGIVKMENENVDIKILGLHFLAKMTQAS